MGRSSTYNIEIADRICEWIASGKSYLTFFEQNDDAPHYSTLWSWLDKFPEFSANYTRARSISADASHDHILALGDMSVAGLVDPAAARVAIDARKWSAGRMKPKIYGERVTHAGDAENPFVISSIELVAPSLKVADDSSEA